VRLDGRTGVGELRASGFEMNMPWPSGRVPGFDRAPPRSEKEQTESSGAAGLERVDSVLLGGVRGSIDSF
jgi:hypothetical protein